eukprot:NODE_427_length_7663_cov_0.258461.p5 type:complete len:302 gc:universal NODE_427_length_7663_cov_0.258461:7186-6281(-)
MVILLCHLFASHYWSQQYNNLQGYPSLLLTAISTKEDILNDPIGNQCVADYQVHPSAMNYAKLLTNPIIENWMFCIDLIQVATFLNSSPFCTDYYKPLANIIQPYAAICNYYVTNEHGNEHETILQTTTLLIHFHQHQEMHYVKYQKANLYLLNLNPDQINQQYLQDLNEMVIDNFYFSLKAFIFNHPLIDKYDLLALNTWNSLLEIRKQQYLQIVQILERVDVASDSIIPIIWNKIDQMNPFSDFGAFLCFFKSCHLKCLENWNPNYFKSQQFVLDLNQLNTLYQLNPFITELIRVFSIL